MSESIDRYSIWRNNVEHFYDMCMSFKLNSPSQSFDFFPKDYRADEFIFKNFAVSGNDPISIRLYDITIPYLNEEEKSSFEIIKKPITFLFNSEINRVKINPVNDNYIAVKTDANVVVFDYTRHRNNEMVENPIFERSEGGGLFVDWSPHKSELLFNTHKNYATIYDFKTKKKFFESKAKYIINDAKFSPINENLIYSVDEGGNYYQFDFRSRENNIYTIKNKEIYSMAISENSDRMAFGMHDGEILIYDSRKMEYPLYKLEHHSSGISSMEFKNNYLASGSDDCNVNIYLNDKIIFSHGGHMNPVTEIRWDDIIENCIMSIDAEGVFMSYIASKIN